MYQSSKGKGENGQKRDKLGKTEMEGKHIILFSEVAPGNGGVMGESGGDGRL